MLRQTFFLLTYFGLLPTVVLSPFAGVLIYKWLEFLPPSDAYYVTLLPDDLSLAVAAFTFLMWLVREKKTLPRAPLVLGLLIAFFLWTNFTSLFALVPDAAAFKWERTVKVIGFSILAAQMMSTRPRLEAFVWVQVICVAFSAIPGALKTISWGGGGLTVIGATGSFIEDRVAFAVFLPMVVPMTLFLARQAILLPRTRWLILALRGIAISCILALVGTFARTALFSGGTAFLLLVAKTKNKIWMVLVAVAAIVLLFELAPASWFERMDTTVNYQHDESALDRLEAWKWSWNMALRHPLVGGGFRVEVLNKVPGGDGYIESHNIVFEVLVEHGFIGLALFGALIAAAYRSCGTVRRLAIDQPDLAWAQDLAGMVQVSLLVFVAGGMFISIATSPFLYDLVSITIGLRSIAEWQRAGLRPATSRLAMPLAPPLAVP
ncbi:MAG TPA: putative O-glycosylation ligase, exosortase A system-associated [Stellaceae bacterium]|nr:putative O-glycosylation ligase, exosortase A system-associated [Stellaceae bacterium]